MFIGIIGAMDVEVEKIKNIMTDVRIEEISSVSFYIGKLSGVDAVAAVSGIGKVNAAVCAQTMILKYNPDILINTGVAGGLSPSLNVGDAAVASAVAEHDMDTTPLGEPAGFISGLNTVYIDCDKKLLDLVCGICADMGINCERGVIASGDQFIASEESKKRITENFNAIAAEMEGAAIGHVCAMNRVPFGVVRAISDSANNDSPVDFPTFTKKAADISTNIIVKIAEEIK